MMIAPEALESNRLFARAWEFWARRSRAGEVTSLPGLTVAWMNVTWPLCNLTFLSEPVATEGDLVTRAKAAVEYARAHPRGWILFLCRELLPPALVEPPPDLLAGCGLTLATQLPGMVADRLLPPRRPLPELEFRRVADPATRRAFAEINGVANKVPLDWAYEALDVPTLWGEGAFAFVGYRDGIPVTTADVLALDGVLYMAMVATLPSEQRKGFAEAVMRHAFAQAQKATGWERTVLHSSRAGFHLYEEMGYRAVAKFFGFTPKAG